MSDPGLETKAALRTLVRAALKKLSPSEKAETSRRICDRLEEQPLWQQAKAIMFFAPLTDEPDIWPLLVKTQAAGKTVALPRFIPDVRAPEASTGLPTEAPERRLQPAAEQAGQADFLPAEAGVPRKLRGPGSYETCQIKDCAADLRLGEFGIREPTPGCAKIALNRLDLILVPGVAFDLAGCRLGRGKGFYDRLLALFRGPACGVAFDQQIVPQVPVGSHDVRLSYILTPTRWQVVTGPRAVLK